VTTRKLDAALIPVGFQTISLANSTAIALNSTIRASATNLHFSVETQHARYRADSTDPTLSTGILLTTGTVYRFTGFNGTSNLKFQRTTGTCTIYLMGYKEGGSNR